MCWAYLCAERAKWVPKNNEWAHNARTQHIAIIKDDEKTSIKFDTFNDEVVTKEKSSQLNRVCTQYNTSRSFPDPHFVDFNTFLLCVCVFLWVIFLPVSLILYFVLNFCRFYVYNVPTTYKLTQIQLLFVLYFFFVSFAWCLKRSQNRNKCKTQTFELKHDG